MGWGVRGMTEIAYFVAGLPGAVRLLPAWPNSVILLIVAGGLWAGLWRRRWRWFGLLPVLAGLIFSFIDKPPDIIVAKDASAIAVRGADGHFALIGRPDEYTAAQWLLRDGDSRTPVEAEEGASCDDGGCIAQLSDGRIVALSLRLGALPDDCARAAIVVSTAPLRRSCTGPRVVIDRFDVAREGAFALWIDGNEVRSVSVADVRGVRPWSGLSSAE
jgi:competence protein ComEC